MENITFRKSLWRFWQKSEISGDTNFVTVESPSTILGLIPTGKVSQTNIPTRMIQNVTTKLHMNVVSAAILVLCVPFFVISVVSCVKGLLNGNFSSFLYYLLYSLPYILLVITSLKRDLVIIHGLAMTRIHFSIFDSNKAKKAADDIVQLQGDFYA